MFADTLTNCAFVVAIVVLATSCGENSEKPNADGAMKRKGDKTVEQPSCAVRAASNAERSSCRDYISDFQYMVSTNRFVGYSAVDTACRVCEDITKMPDKEEVLRLLEQLMDLAVKQPLADISFRKIRYGVTIPKPKVGDAEYGNEPHFDAREQHLCNLWDVTRVAFDYSQPFRSNRYEGWDRLFAFYSKWASEIEETEKKLSAPPPKGMVFWKSQNSGYLHGLKVNLKQAIYSIRDRELLEPSGRYRKDLTEDQLADILRRFKEIEQFAAMPVPLSSPQDSGSDDK